MQFICITILYLAKQHWNNFVPPKTLLLEEQTPADELFYAVGNIIFFKMSERKNIMEGVKQKRLHAPRTML